MIPVATLAVQFQAMNPPKPIGIGVMVDGKPIAMVEIENARAAALKVDLMAAARATDESSAIPLKDVLDPQWEKAGRVHDWRNYVSEELQRLWPGLDPELRLVLARSADEPAGREDWD